MTAETALRATRTWEAFAPPPVKKKTTSSSSWRNCKVVQPEDC